MRIGNEGPRGGPWPPRWFRSAVLIVALIIIAAVSGTIAIVWHFLAKWW